VKIASLLRLAVLVGIVLAGVFLRNYFLVTVGIGALVGVVALHVMKRRGAITSAWKIATIFTSIGCFLAGLLIYALAFNHGPLGLRLCALILLFPIAYFLYLGWAAGYFASTGSRHPLTYRVGHWMERASAVLNRDVGRRP
jgi:uncharacterized membrane protein